MSTSRKSPKRSSNPRIPRSIQKPYSSFLLNIHKFISLGAVVYLARIVFQHHRATALSTLELNAGVMTGVFFLAGIISGGLASINKPLPAAVLTFHQVIPYLTVISTAVTLYLLASGV